MWVIRMSPNKSEERFVFLQVLKTQEAYRASLQQEEEERLQQKRDEFERAKCESDENTAKSTFDDQIGSLT